MSASRQIVSWNVNSLNMRLNHLERFVKDSDPDVILLQETKCANEKFPKERIEELGYNTVFHGQKSYNGVAILSKAPIEDVFISLIDEGDAEARYIEAITYLGSEVVRVASVYVPNGMAVSSPKFQSKMKFFAALHERMRYLHSQHEITLVGGDLNVAPNQIDVYDPVHLAGDIGFHPEERKWFNMLLQSGFKDSFRIANNNKQEFSWWDYRSGGWQHNKGMRIDHILLSPEACDLLIGAGIHTNLRGWEKPSDHAPVYCCFGVR
jgi:exodeoxyribonuclease-3